MDVAELMPRHPSEPGLDSPPVAARVVSIFDSRNGNALAIGEHQVFRFALHNARPMIRQRLDRMSARAESSASPAAFSAPGTCPRNTDSRTASVPTSRSRARPPQRQQLANP